MTIPCSCGGSNENCAWCYGRGWLEGDRIPVRSRASRRISTWTPKPPDPPVPCDICAVLIRPKKFKKHMAEVHGVVLTVPLPADMTKCDICGVPVSQRKLESHKRRVHSLRPIGGAAVTLVQCSQCNFFGTVAGLAAHTARWHQPRVHLPVGKGANKSKKRRGNAIATGRIALPPNMTTCSICGNPVAFSELELHKAKVHGAARAVTQHEDQGAIKPPQTTQEKKAKTTAPEGAGAGERLDRWKKDLQAWQSLHQRNLDATKDYAHNFRESGKFGSHPSHDGFDDESGS